MRGRFAVAVMVGIVFMFAVGVSLARGIGQAMRLPGHYRVGQAVIGKAEVNDCR